MTTRLMIGACLTAVWVTTEAPAARQESRSTPNHVIDLLGRAPEDDDTVRRVPEDQRLRMPFGPQGTPTHTPPLPQPLALRVLALDRTSYRIGDKFVSGFRKRAPDEWTLNLGMRGSIHIFSWSQPIPSVTSENVVSIQLAGPRERE